MLHPGLTDSRAFAPNIDAFAARFRVFTPERRGHGRTPDVAGPITFELMAEERSASWSRSSALPAPFRLQRRGFVALLVALRRPDLVHRLVFVAGVFHHDGWLPGVIDPSNKPPEFLADLYARYRPTVGITSRSSSRTSRRCT